MSSSSGSRDIDPLLKDLDEKNQSFRRNVVSLASELKDVRSRLATREQSYVHETRTRQEAEIKAKIMEEEVSRLSRSLDERDEQLRLKESSTEKYLDDLDDLRSQLAATQATAEASDALAQSSQIQCVLLLKELDEKNNSIKEQENRVNRLADQLDLLQKDLQAREFSQKQLKSEVTRMENDIMEALAKAGANSDCELRRILDEVSPKNFDKINKLLSAKDEEIAMLRDEIQTMSSHWNLKTKELESELEKRRRVDQELKKRVLKLEYFLQEARTQTRGRSSRQSIKKIEGAVSSKATSWNFSC